MVHEFRDSFSKMAARRNQGTLDLVVHARRRREFRKQRSSSSSLKERREAEGLPKIVKTKSERFSYYEIKSAEKPLSQDIEVKNRPSKVDVQLGYHWRKVKDHTLNANRKAANKKPSFKIETREISVQTENLQYKKRRNSPFSPPDW